MDPLIQLLCKSKDEPIRKKAFLALHMAIAGANPQQISCVPSPLFSFPPSLTFLFFTLSPRSIPLSLSISPPVSTLAGLGCLPPVCDFLKVSDTSLILMALDSIERILRVRVDCRRCPAPLP